MFWAYHTVHKAMADEIDASTVSQGSQKEWIFGISYMKHIMFPPCIKCLVECPHGLDFLHSANKEWQHRNIQFKTDWAEHRTDQQLLHLNNSNPQQCRVNTKSILIIQVPQDADKANATSSTYKLQHTSYTQGWNVKAKNELPENSRPTHNIGHSHGLLHPHRVLP
jgi:hypothetical protein